MFVHTLRTQLEMFLGVMDELDTARVEAIAVDLPGHGQSTAPAVEYTADYFSDRVAGLLDQLDLDTLATPASPSHDSGFVKQAPRPAVCEERER